MHYTVQEKLVLRALSADSRATVTYLAKIAGCSRVTAIRIVNKLTKQFNLKFTLEMNLDKLGLNERYLVALKFRECPSEDILIDTFKSDVYAQNVYKIKGNFDLLIYVVTDSAENYIKWETHVAEKLSQYGLRIMPSRHIFSHFGFMPLNSAFTDFVDTERGLDETDKLILKKLNDNSRVSYKELGLFSNVTEATARYRLFRLHRKGIINRFTVVAQSLDDNYACMVYFINYTFSKTTSSISFANARRSYLMDDNNSPMFNTFQLIFPVSGSWRSFGMVLSESKKVAVEKAIKRHKRIFRDEKIKMLYGQVVKPIKGLLPYRNLDIEKEYKIINWHTVSI